MYRAKTSGWLKYFDFIILDILMLHLAFIISYFIRNPGSLPYSTSLYVQMGIVLTLADFLLFPFIDTLNSVLTRGYYKEFTATLRHVILVELLSMLYLFSTKQGDDYSRVICYLTGCFYLLFTYIARVLWKKNYRLLKREKERSHAIIITTQSHLDLILEKIEKYNFESYEFIGIYVVDGSDEFFEQNANSKIPMVCSLSAVFEYVVHEWVDEAFIFLPTDAVFPTDIIEALTVAGITTHYNLPRAESVLGQRKLVENICGFLMLTTTMNYMTTRQTIIKRIFDICFGLVGSLFTLLLCLILGPIIFIASPGPVFFTQTRVGRNGRKFQIYKFRSMYLDAEARKKELESQNLCSKSGSGDGFMFKLDFDPRIIGCKRRNDGTIKKGIGNFIRDWSLDEFPQFFNVLFGDMSVVGTRPPTVDEWNRYDIHHRARLATRPGITGLWQVSGRSQITDFEEVVRLDTQYINQWNLGQDIKIVLKTIKVVLDRSGAK